MATNLERRLPSPPAPGATTAGPGPALTDTLLDLARVLQFRDRDVACCYGLSVSQCYALKAIVDQGAMTVNDLARHLFMDKSTASRVADALLRMGHITRTTDPRDRRAVRLAPTASGRKVCRRIVEELDAECADLLEAYSPEVADALIHLLGRLTRNVSGRASGAGCCVRATPGT